MCAWLATELVSPAFWKHFSQVRSGESCPSPVVRDGASFAKRAGPALLLGAGPTFPCKDHQGSLCQGQRDSGLGGWVDNSSLVRVGSVQQGPHNSTEGLHRPIL